MLDVRLVALQFGIPQERLVQIHHRTAPEPEDDNPIVSFILDSGDYVAFKVKNVHDA
jgi:hypothetical protein